MSKKKIVMIHHSGLIGGASISFYHTWKALSTKYDIVAYVADDPTDFSNFLAKEKLQPRLFDFRLGKITYYSGGNKLIYPKFWYHFIRIFTQIGYWKSVLEKEKPDLVIVNSKVLCWMGGILKGYKSICFVRETIIGNANNHTNRLINRYLEKFTLVSFITKYDLEETDLKKAHSIVTRDFMKTENYIDKYGKIEACNRLKANHTTFNVLFVGGINNLKGIDVALKAINLIKNEKISLLVAGNALDYDRNMKISKKLKFKIKNFKTIRLNEKVHKYIRNNNLQNTVRFIGVHTDISLPYSACDLLILPMKKPHQARPIFEIGVQKKTVIISDFPHIYDSVKDNYNGLTFKPNNAQDLADKIMLLKNNNELRKKLGLCNFKRALNNHSQETVIETFLSEVKKIL